MEKKWLRPSSGIPTLDYLQVAKDLAQKPIHGGMRVPHNDYFNGNNNSNPPTISQTWVIDRMQCRKAIWNVLRSLMVKEKEQFASTIEEWILSLDLFSTITFLCYDEAYT